MSIKMICSDLDGTILTYDQTVLTDRLLEQIKELNRRGIIFVPASGRQIISMQKLFAPVTECCNYICSNGAVICDGAGNVIGTTPIPREDAIAIAHDFMDRTDGRGEVNVAAAKCCYLMSRDLGMVDRVKYIGNKYEIIDDPAAVNESIVKVSVFLPDGTENYIDRFRDKWKKYNPAIAGPYWIDSTLANKGTGVDMLCKLLGIKPEEVMAFGDNYNDISMLDMVGRPYIMDTAADELLKRYPNHVASVEDCLEKYLLEE